MTAVLSIAASSSYCTYQEENKEVVCCTKDAQYDAERFEVSTQESVNLPLPRLLRYPLGGMTRVQDTIPPGLSKD